MPRPLSPAKIEFEDRYILRPVEPNDVPQIEEAFQASLPELSRFMRWAHQPLGREKFLERVLNQYSQYFKGTEYELALFDKAHDEFFVYTGFYPVSRINPLCLEIGYWVASKHAGKGFATLATRIEIALLFEYFQSDRIEITCSIENKPSLRVIEKCGFQFEGELRNFYPRGTPQMYADGFVKERRAALFAVTSQDRQHLPWYEEIVNGVTLYPLLENPKPLRYYVSSR